MYAPYPNRISKLRINILFIETVLLAVGLIYFHIRQTIHQFPPQYFEFMEMLSYLMLGAIIFLSFKIYSIKFSRDYLYFAAAALILITLKLLKAAGAVSIAPLSIILQPIENLPIGHLFLSALLVFTSYSAGKAVPVKRRLFYGISIPVSTLIISILTTYGFTYFLAPLYPFGILRPVVTIITVILFAWAVIRFIRLYIQKSVHIYFWFMHAVCFFIFARLYLFAEQQPFDMFQFIGSISMLVGYSSLVMVIFEEHTRFMESEIEIRKSLEKSLYQVEQNFENYRTLVNKVDVGIIVVDEDGLITFANDNMGQIIGMPREQIIGKNQTALFDAVNLEKFLIEREKLASGLNSQFEIEVKNRKDQNIPVMMTSVPVTDRIGRFRGSRNVVIRISAWKEFERRIKEYSEDLEQKIEERTREIEQKSEEWKQAKTYYETLISGMLDILLVVDEQGNCVFINDYGKKLLGYEPDELKRRKLPDFFADMKNLRKSYGDSMKVELRDYEAPVKTKSGQEILCSWNVRYLFDTKGKNIGAMCVGRDVSEYKAMQQKLEEHSKNLEQQVSKRTSELNIKVNQMAKILKIGEDIILNVNLPDILKHICQAIKSMGWKMVLVSIKTEKAPSSKIAAHSGIQKNRLGAFMSKYETLFSNTLKYLRNEYRIGNSFYLEYETITNENFMAQGLEAVDRTDTRWSQDSVLLSPLKVKNRILGFLMVFDPADGCVPTEEELNILEIFAQKAAVAIENNNLFKRAEIRAQESENINKIKSEFFASMSHELRTPLNSILTLASILLQKMSGELNTEQMRQIKIIRRNGERLLKLINDILDLSKIEAGRMDVNYSYFPFMNVIHANMDTIRPLAEAKDLKLELKVDKNVPQYIFSDRDKLDHVLTNLISNAVKFTNRGKITVAAEMKKRDNVLSVSVQDTGIGFDKDDSEFIFEPFRQSENQENPHKKGTGLGLSISRQLMRMLEGDILVESKKGRGSTFRILLPLKEVGDKQKLGTQRVKELEAQQPPLPKPEKTVKNQNSKKSILLVDDNLDNQYALKFILEDKGYKVFFAKNGQEGVKKAQKEKPALILMDMMMPGMNGYEATANIRSKRGMKDIPIIAMTAKTAAEDDGKALAAGCVDYLSKPFSLDDIVNTVNKWIGGN
ncbi:PAS domain S-box protein [candidate division KSB1 bacterium]|nr:PAS domain S-box protein [candidate division KSB1 bacterium]